MNEPSVESLQLALESEELGESAAILSRLAPPEIAFALDHLPQQQRGVAFRLLSKEDALDVFENLEPAGQRELVELLGEREVADVFERLDPDDRVGLLDELPATVATSLVRQMPADQRNQTAMVLGYPRGSIGRRMSPEFVHVHPSDSLDDALARVRVRGRASETIYTVPVTDDSRRLVGVVSLRDLLLPPGTDQVYDHMSPPMFAFADEDAEEAARRCVERRVLAFPVLDRERRLLGMLTIDDATRIVEAAHDEDTARAGAAEPLRRPYLLTPVTTIARSRVVWLLVLGVSAILTVNVLELFQATLEQRVALALFIPLLTGIGGNTGSQAATTVTRALAMGEARSRDVGSVALKECGTGLLLGSLLGAAGFAAGSLAYSSDIGAVIGVTLLSVCTLSATVGGVMPLVAKWLRVDPAVFSTPFISTFCDATGLIIYFTIAQVILGI